MIDYFKEINRALTSLIAGIIAAVIFGGMFYILSMQDGLSGPVMILLLYVVLYLAIQLSQILQYYFFTLLDKDRYQEMGSTVWTVAVVHLILLIVGFPFLFLLNSTSGNSSQIVLMSLVFFAQVASLIARENHSASRQLANAVGMFVVLMFVMMINTNFGHVIGSGLPMQMYQTAILIPVLMFTGSVFEFVGEILKSIIQIKEDESPTDQI